MVLCRVFQNPDGSVRILRLNPRMPHVTLGDEAAKDKTLEGLPFVDIDESAIPTDRSERHKWRVQGGSVVVDKAAPERPHPKQALLNKIRAANSVNEIKALLEEIIA